MMLYSKQRIVKTLLQSCHNLVTTCSMLPLCTCIYMYSVPEYGGQEDTDVSDVYSNVEKVEDVVYQTGR